jgi:hypothetical protein
LGRAWSTPVEGIVGADARPNWREHRAQGAGGPTLTADQLLTGSPGGCTEAIMLAHGFQLELLADLVRDALASAAPGLRWRTVPSHSPSARSPRMPRPAPAVGTPLAHAKAQCRAAYQGAKAADAMRGAMLDRLYVETLQATAGAPAAASAEMWRQSRILFQIFHNRAGWPGNML